MKLLALETSCEHGSIALYDDGAVTGVTMDGYANHSGHILQSIATLLSRTGTTLEMLDAIAFGCGPGAFTGLRLACGVAQGLGLGAEKTLVPVSSLAALALQADAAQVVAATDARMGQIYYGCFTVKNGDAHVVGDVHCTPPGGIALPDGEWLGIGSAFSVYPDLKTALGKKLADGIPDAVPRADEIARLAAIRVEHGETVAPEEAALLYVRDKVALTTAERLAGGGKA